MNTLLNRTQPCFITMDPKEQSEILWQLHSIGEKLDNNYKLSHYCVSDRTTQCERYVIEYNYQKKNEKE